MDWLPAGIRLRESTYDEGIAYDILVNNCYRMPDTFGPDDVMIDVGCHIGMASYAALSRGMGCVYAFDPDPQNLRMAAVNLAPFADRVKLHELAVWRSDRDAEILQFTGYNVDGKGILNTGGGTVYAWAGTLPVFSIGLDTVIDQIRADRDRGVRLLKLDCEASEFPILFTAQRLGAVQTIAGEFHEMCGPRDEWAGIPDVARIPGIDVFSVETLSAYLRSHGYGVDSIIDSGNLGRFWAEREVGRRK